MGSTMQAAQDYSSLKANLEEKVTNLKGQRDAAQKEVESLSLRVVIRELQKQAKFLEDELNALSGKKSLLEQKLATLDAPQAQSAPPQQRPPVRPVGQPVAESLP